MEYLTVEGTKWNIITLIFLLAKLGTLIRFLLGKHLHDIDIDGWLAWRPDRAAAGPPRQSSALRTPPVLHPWAGATCSSA
eukprot:COSAG01_NODE_33691_length_560_cov_1.034707_1_plen_79_part_10